MVGCIVLAALLGLSVFTFFGVLRKVLIGRWYQAERMS
jgi:hypothetical protein